MEKYLLEPSVGLAVWTRGSFAQGSLCWTKHFLGGTFIIALNRVGQLIFAGHLVGEWKE